MSAPEASQPTNQITDGENAEQLDPALQPFEVSLYFPARPLLPAGAVEGGLPETSSPLKLSVTPQETLNDLRMTLIDSPEGYWLGAFCFRLPSAGKKNGSANGSTPALGERCGEWVELQELFKDLPEDATRDLYVTHVPFNEADARAHVQRLRELLSGGQADPTSLGIDGGISIHDAVKHPDLWVKEAASAATPSLLSKSKGGKNKEAEAEEQPTPNLPFLDWAGWAASPTSSLIPEQARPPRAFPTCLRTLAIAPWNPPPQYLRIQGHLLYLQIGTLEGDNIYITASTQGFYINRSNSFQFDPSPREGQAYQSCSLFDVLCGFSKLFLANFSKLFHDPVSTRDYLSVLPATNCLPAHPWMARVHAHSADPLRNQAAYVLTGATSTDTLEGTRDWNDELQSTRELPRDTLPERLVRDKVLNRAYAEFTLAAARAVPRVAAGEVQAMNPMDGPETHMFICNNLFISKGTDGVDIYPHMGGDEAAHVAVGKDLHGIRTLNNLDVEGLCLLGTVVVDWKGERWVAQSVVPGLFRRRDDGEEEEEALKAEAKDASAESAVAKVEPAAEPAVAPQEAKAAAAKPDLKEDTQVVYGGVEGPEVIRTDASFHRLFSQIARTLHLALHDVEDAEGVKKSLWLSVDSKGLRGADGRKYALDLARLSPIDILWLEKDFRGPVLASDESASSSEAPAYPHRMTLLRNELLDAYHDSEFRSWAREQLAAHQKAAEEAKTQGEETKEGETAAAAEAARIDPAAFQLSFNPDAFVEFKAAEGEGAPKTLVTDESDPTVAAVRKASTYLRDVVIPRLVSDVASGGHVAQDGTNLTRQMHSRGINMRYLGYLAQLCEPAHKDKLDQDVLTKAGPGHEAYIKVLREIAVQEMVLRASKRVLRALLKPLALVDSPACISHFLNCLLGTAVEAKPSAVWKASPLFLDAAPPAWVSLTPESLIESLRVEVRKRYRYEVPSFFFHGEIRKPQLLRELAQRCGFQLKLHDYVFEVPLLSFEDAANGSSDDKPTTNSALTVNGKTKKKKAIAAAKKASERGPRTTTFEPEDVLHLLPVVKDSTPKSNLAEEAFETGRITVARGDRALGFDFLGEGLQYHEQVYGIVHPEMARCHSTYATVLHHFASLAAAEHEQRCRQAQSEGKEAPPAPELGENFSMAQAARFQRQAVTLYERTFGLDHHETITQWQNLAILERADGNLEASLRCLQRVLELFDLIYGREHPDSIQALSQIGQTLQAGRLLEASLKVFLSTHKLALKLHGADSMQAAAAAHDVSQAYTFRADLKNALAYAKETLRVFEARLGKDDPQTRDQQTYLTTITASAVHLRRIEREREQAARAGRRAPPTIDSVLQQRTLGESADVPSSSSLTGPAPSRTANGQDQASIEDLVAYISGGQSKGSSKGKSKASSSTTGLKRTKKSSP